MIDREASGGFRLWKSTAGEVEDTQNQLGISNKTKVSLVIVALIIVLCIVYAFQLRSARHSAQAPETAVVSTTAETAATAQTAETAAVEEAPAEAAEDSSTK
jgi:zona occludens toxin (predicted ATPase)